MHGSSFCTLWIFAYAVGPFSEGTEAEVMMGRISIWRNGKCHFIPLCSTTGCKKKTFIIIINKKSLKKNNLFTAIAFIASVSMLLSHFQVNVSGMPPVSVLIPSKTSDTYIYYLTIQPFVILTKCIASTDLLKLHS